MVRGYNYNQNDKECNQIDKEYKQNDLLTEYGTTTTAYLLMAMSIDSLEHKNKQLETENAKLRELVKQMYPIAKADLQLGVVLGCKDTMSYDWALQMTELGIEVN